MRKRSFGIIVILFTLICFLDIGWYHSVATAQGEASIRPMTLSELDKLLTNCCLTEGFVAALIERGGIAFDPTPEVIERLRAKGAHQHLINTIKRAAEKKSASAGNLVITGPSPKDPFIEATRKVVRDYIEELPDFICQQIIDHYSDYHGRGIWTKRGKSTYELTYNSRRESYKPVNEAGKPVTQPIDKSGSAYSTGDFASRLAALFDEETKTIFKPAGKGRQGNRSTQIYDFSVPKETSRIALKVENFPLIICGYSGTVWIDAETKQVLRFESALDNIPADYPITKSELSVTYDNVKLADLDLKFLLPIRAEFIIGDYRRKHYNRNQTSFKSYRKFVTDIKIYEETASPPPSKKP